MPELNQSDLYREMPFRYVKAKLVILAARIVRDQLIKFSSRQHEKSIIAQFVDEYSHNRGATHESIARELQLICKDEEDHGDDIKKRTKTSLTRDLTERMCQACSLTEADLDWFFKGPIDAFEKMLAAHKILTPASLSPLHERYHLVGGRVDRLLGADFASLNTQPMGANAPMDIALQLSAELIRIMEEKLAFGFSRLLIDIVFEKGSNAQLTNCLGNGPEGYTFSGGHRIILMRDGRAPQFEVTHTNQQTPLSFFHEFEEPIGTVNNILEGETFEVRLRAERRRGMIAFDSEDTATDNAREKVITALISNTLYLGKGRKRLKLDTTEDGRFILFCTQHYMATCDPTE